MDIRGIEASVKELESEQNGGVLNPKLYTVVRIDGHSFHTFTKRFDKPFDKELSKAMIETTKELVYKFCAITGYTQSDEITLLLPPGRMTKLGDIECIIFGGRRDKINSVFASYTSARFNHHVLSFARDPTSEFDEEKRNKMEEGVACFDCRCFNATLDQTVKIFWWRYRDCFRNGVMNISRTLFSQKELHKKSIPQQIEMLKQRGFSPQDFDPRHLFGSFVKRSECTIKTVDKSTNVEVTITRKFLVQKSVSVNESGGCFTDLVTRDLYSA